MSVQDSWGSDISLATIVHLAQTIPERSLRCILDARGFSTIGIADCDCPTRNGSVAAPNRPGLGITPHLEVLGRPIASYP